MSEILLTLTLDKFPDYGDLMTREAFDQNVKSGMFIDYDGYGYLATEKGYLRLVRVYPSEWVQLNHVAPEEFTHVLWFNR
jgi:hypothetical protein